MVSDGTDENPHVYVFGKNLVTTEALVAFR